MVTHVQGTVYKEVQGGKVNLTAPRHIIIRWSICEYILFRLVFVSLYLLDVQQYNPLDLLAIWKKYEWHNNYSVNNAANLIFVFCNWDKMNTANKVDCWLL